MPNAPEILGIAAAATALGAGGVAYASVWPTSRLFGAALSAPRNPAGEKQIALTFDDGPHPRWTPILLEILARAEVRATFFLLGKYAVDQKPLVREMHRAGHGIGNHTWSHPNLALTGGRRTREEMVRTSRELEQMLGAPVRFFRPPFGGRRPATFKIARELGLTPVLWNAMTADWQATDSGQVTARLAKMVGRNADRGYASSIVLHDGGQTGLDVDRSASVAAAGQIVERFGARHRFVTLEEWV